MRILLNLDAPDLDAARHLYRHAFGLEAGRRFGDAALELLGAAAPIYLLRQPDGSAAATGCKRDYRRHWTPLHLDVVVDDLDTALPRAVDAGLLAEGPVRDTSWGRIVRLADPFGHGWCLLQFSARGYDALLDPA